ncbi:MAG TPA: hypothetical protein VGE52_09720 [Pirellulales bacterium]
MDNFKGNIEVRKIGDAIALASNTDNNSSRVDMSGFEGAIFFGVVNDSVATGLAKITIEGNSVDSDTGMSALVGMAAQLVSAVNDDVNGKIIAVEVAKPLQRYLQAVRTTTTANMAFGELYVALYGAKSLPRANHSTVGALTFGVSPAKS